MGVIYVGRHLQTERQAAVKVIERASPETLARFKLEASISALVGHPGIVEALDADIDAVSGSCFIAMELLEGHTLRSIMDDSSATPAQVLGHLVAALEPLVAAHEAGLVHRDLKPENIFVCSRSASAAARVKLLDFGIVAQQSDQRLTRAGTTMGTPHYMSPEQATSARDAGPSSDVWSMGVMMYEAIRGEVPFSGETAPAVIVAVCTCPHAPLDGVAPGVDPLIARLIDRCLAKSPAERPADARALLSELRSLLYADSLPSLRPSLKPRPDQAAVQSEPADARPSARTRDITSALRLLTAAGVVAGASVVALPLSGLAATSTALLCASVSGVLLYFASTRLRTLKALASTAPAANDNGARQVVVRHEPAPQIIEHPQRGSEDAPMKIEIFADLSCAITRRACQRVLALRAQHPDEIALVYRPLWDLEREHARLIAETARAVFERDGSEIFWELFDRIIATTRKITPATLDQAAQESGAEMHGLSRAMRASLHRRSLLACREEAEMQGITDSPTLLVNGSVLHGDLTEDRLHWAYMDTMNAVSRKRAVELGTTRAALTTFDREPRMFRGLLIRYRGARDAPATLRRTREQAYERACKLMARAQVPGSDFVDIALRFADSLLEDEELAGRKKDLRYKDAVRGLGVRELSQPIECDEGYQIVQRVA